MTRNEIKEKYSYYFINDLDIPYIPFKYRKSKDKVIYIKPILMKNYFDFLYSISTFRIEDEEYVPKSMNYLDYLIYLFNEDIIHHIKEDDEKHNILHKFYTIMSLCLGYDYNEINIVNNKKGKPCILLGDYCYGYIKSKNINAKIVVPVVTNKDIEVSYNEIKSLEKDINWIGDMDITYGDRVEYLSNFDDCIELGNKDILFLKQIVNYQNIYEYNDDYLHPALRESLKREQELRSKLERNQKIDFEKQRISFVQSYTQYKYSDINDELSIRRFYSLLSLDQDKEMWRMMTQAQFSGMVKFKEPIKNYLCEKSSNVLDNMIKADDLKNKIK